MTQRTSDDAPDHAASSRRRVRAIRPDRMDEVRALASPGHAAWIEAHGFAAAAASLLTLPGPDGIEGALFGLGAGGDPLVFGALATTLPDGDWVLDADGLAGTGFSPDDAVLGWRLGSHGRRRSRAADRQGAASPAPRLAIEGAQGIGEDIARATILARDLIDRPANLLGPAELADAAAAVAAAHGAGFRRTEGEALATGFPAIEAVGQGSVRKPVVATISWRGSGAGDDAPLVSLVGKGVCFDTGGYDLKPSASMLRMKKDMGGAAVMLGLADLVMRRDLPVRLELRIGCVENSVSGTAMRPSDVIRTRAGISVEVNNTDAEGRLVLADLLAEACEAKPALLLDAATLTGAARTALGPDLPALFTDDEALAAAIAEAGRATHDPVWRLPLWDGYDDWLSSQAAELSNVSAKPMAGAITAALFLRRFVTPGTRWAHLDAYCWNDRARPGRPEGADAPCLRGLHRLLTNLCDSGMLKLPTS